MRAEPLLALCFVTTSLGIMAELLLVDHVEDIWQVVPLALGVLGLAAMVWVSAAGSRAASRSFLLLMWLFMISGVIGLWLHYRANAEFELEMYPDMSGVALLWKAIQGASPPSLAPGAMIALALMGFAWAAIRENRGIET